MSFSRERSVSDSANQLNKVCAKRVLAEVNLCSREDPPSNQRFTFEGGFIEAGCRVQANAVTLAVSSRSF
jgi:hypothetical protein